MRILYAFGFIKRSRIRTGIHLIRIRIQHFRLNTDPDPDPGFWWPKIGEIFKAEKKFLLSKTTTYLSLGLHKSRPSDKISLQLLKENIQHFQNMKFLIFFFYFCGSSLPSWIRIRIPNTDPDPLTWLNSDPIGIRIRNPDLYAYGPFFNATLIGFAEKPRYSSVPYYPVLFFHSSVREDRNFVRQDPEGPPNTLKQRQSWSIDKFYCI